METRRFPLRRADFLQEIPHYQMEMRRTQLEMAKKQLVMRRTQLEMARKQLVMRRTQLVIRRKQMEMRRFLAGIRYFHAGNADFLERVAGHRTRIRVGSGGEE